MTLAPAHRAATGTVLYIEDNPSNIRLVRLLLERRPGVTVVATHTALLGIETAIAERPDLVLLDIHLPDLDGRLVLERLRAQPETRAIPVAALTADAMPAAVEAGLAAGFDHYLTKPIELEALLDIVDHHLGGEQAGPG